MLIRNRQQSRSQFIRSIRIPVREALCLATCAALATAAPDTEALTCPSGFADFSTGANAVLSAGQAQSWLPAGSSPIASVRLNIEETELECEAGFGGAYLGPHAVISAQAVYEVSIPTAWFATNNTSVVVELQSDAATHAQIVGASGFGNLASLTRLFTINAQLFGGDASTLAQAGAGDTLVGEATGLSLDGYAYGSAQRDEQVLRWTRRLSPENPRVFITAIGSASVRYALAGQSSPGALTVADLEARAAISMAMPTLMSQTVELAPVSVRKVTWADVAAANGQPVESVQPGALTFASFDGTGINEDTDGDGVGDYDEIIRGSEPLSSDTDRDGVRDNVDQAPTTPSHSPDSDGDGLGDALEVIIGTSPFNGDTDGDGLSDGEEVILASNPLVANSGLPGPDDEFEVEPLPSWFIWYLHDRRTP